MNIRGKNVKKAFSSDKIKALWTLSTKWMKWSNDTIKKTLKIHFAASPTGYKELQILLPVIRTLQRRMQCVKFEP